MLPGRVSGDLRDEMKLLLAAAASSLGVPRGVVGGVMVCAVFRD